MKRRFIVAIVSVLLAAMMVAPISASASTWQVMKINVEGARLRTGPGSYPAQPPSLSKGQKVLYAGKHQNAFCYVLTSGGRTGWVYKPFLTPYGAVDGSRVYKVKSNSKLYGTSSSVKGGEYVAVFEVHGGWAFVKKMSGKGGYLKTSNLKKV